MTFLNRFFCTFHLLMHTQKPKSKPMNTASPKSAFSLPRAILCLMLFAFISAARGQNPASAGNEWWSPIVQKHKIDIEKYDYRAVFEVYNGDTKISSFLELGKKQEEKDGLLILKKAVLIVLNKLPDESSGRQLYYIAKSDQISHDRQTNVIEVDYTRFEWFELGTTGKKPVRIQKGTSRIDLSSELQIKASTFRKF